MNTVITELSFAIRRLRRVRAFAATSIAVIAVGVGTATFVLSVVDTMLLRELPYERPETLAVITPPVPLPYWSAVEQLSDETSVFERIGAYALRAVNVSGDGRAERVLAARATNTFFPVTGVRAALGRIFVDEEFEPGHDKVVLLSDALWRRRYHGVREVMGRTLNIDGEGYTIVGVLPPDFKTIDEMRPAHEVSFNAAVDLVTPLAGRPLLLDHRSTDYAEGARGITIVARLRKDVPLEQARSVAATVTRRTIPIADAPFVLSPLRQSVAGDLPRQLAVVLGAVGLLLLVACGNQANLILLRLNARRQEMAIRLALGATSRQLVVTVLAETMLLAGLGGLGGVLTAWAGIVATKALGGPMVTRLDELQMSLPVLAFGTILALGTTLLVSLVPAVRLARTPAGLVLHGEAASAPLPGRLSVPSLLVGGQVALSLVLVIGGILLSRDLVRSIRTPLGYRSERVLTAEVSLDRTRYRPVAATAFFTSLLERTAQLPGVDKTALTDVVPGGQFVGFSMIQAAGRTSELLPVQKISEGYFSLLSIPILAGRSFAVDDREDTARVVIVNEAFARKYFSDPTLALERDVFIQSTRLRVVGVVAAVQWWKAPAIYVCHRQFPSGATQMTLLVQVRQGDAMSLAKPLVRVASELDPAEPLYNLLTLDRIAFARFARLRLIVAAMTAFAGLTLVLAAIGVHGVMGYAMALRRREIAVRLAVGGPAGAIARLMLRRTAAILGGGIAIGLPVVFAIALVAESQIFGFAGVDLVTCAGAVALVVVAGLLASLAPVLRAVRIDPIATLRAE